MVKLKEYLLPSLILLLTVSIFYSFIEIKNKFSKNEIKDQSFRVQNIPNSANKNSADCDPDLWKYVYNPKRLQIIDKCIAVTGIIEESSVNEDGDQHMLLKLDKGHENLLTQKNIKRKAGRLVIEAVCINKAEVRKVGNTCAGYINKVHIPKVGDRVKVTGSYVIDTHNGWGEIHPVSKIEVE